MVKPPVVYNAGLLRALGRGIDTSAWTWLGGMAGQQLFYPPNVAGWDDTRWLDTATFRGRWYIATYALEPYALDPAKSQQTGNAQQLLDQALAFWHASPLGDETKQALLSFAGAALGDAGRASWKRAQYPVMVENALRHLIAVSPEFQTS
jgi:hypothetical protein